MRGESTRKGESRTLCCSDVAQYLGIRESNKIQIILILQEKSLISVQQSPMKSPCIVKVCGYKRGYRGHDTKNYRENTHTRKCLGITI